MRKIFILLMVILPLLSSGQARKIYREALRTDDLQKKISLLDEVINQEPNNLDAYFYRALAKNDSGNYLGAIVDYSKILLVEPDADTYFNRGNSRYNLKDYEGAKADYAKAYEMDKNFVDARYSLACTKYDLGEYEEAIEDFDAILKVIPDLQIAYTLRASAYFALEDFKNALKDYTYAIYVRPDSDAFYNRGVFYLDIKYYQKAKSDLNTALRLDRDNPFIYFHRGAANLFLGDYKDAIDDFLNSLKFDSLDFDAMLGLAMTYYKMDDLENAKLYFSKAKSIVAPENESDSLDIFEESYWYSKQYYYFLNAVEDIMKI